jgi:hypothetical protein
MGVDIDSYSSYGELKYLENVPQNIFFFVISKKKKKLLKNYGISIFLTSGSDLKI